MATHPVSPDEGHVDGLIEERSAMRAAPIVGGGMGGRGGDGGGGGGGGGWGQGDPRVVLVARMGAPTTQGLGRDPHCSRVKWEV